MEGIPEDLNYELKVKDGIVYVYNTAEALAQEQPRSLPYPDLETFAIDMSHVLAMIADGPTWVHSGKPLPCYHGNNTDKSTRKLLYLHKYIYILH